jgi:voltage-gated sodium channel
MAKRGGAKHGGSRRGATTGPASGSTPPALPAVAGHGPRRLRRVVANPGFIAFTHALIAMNALALGVEALPAMAEPFEGLLGGLFAFSTVWFVIEIALRMLAHGKPLGGFFRDGWNTFDTAIVVLSLLPLAGGVAIVARLARLLRLLRLVSGNDLLRGFVERRLPAGPHLLAAGVLLALSIYAFALAGFHLAGGMLAEPGAWADLPNALRSTLGWSVVVGAPALPSDGVDGMAWLAALGAAHLAWLVLTVRGLLGARAQP